MERVDCLDALFRKYLRPRQQTCANIVNFLCQLDQLSHHAAMFCFWMPTHFVLHNGRGDKQNGPALNHLHNNGDCLCLQPDTRLRLIIKRTHVDTGVKIDSAHDQ